MSAKTLFIVVIGGTILFLALVELLNADLSAQQEIPACCTFVAEKMAISMAIVESDNNPQCLGRSGEYGRWQFMPATWRILSTRYNMSVNGVKKSLLRTSTTEREVVVWKVERLLMEGFAPFEIALIWNTSLGGDEKPYIRKGINKKGVPYDSKLHAEKVIAELRRQLSLS